MTDAPPAAGGQPPLRVQSFDVFDTLITRIWFRPSDLFFAAGHELRRKGLFAGDPDAWETLRRQAEREARDRPGTEEVTLDDIYAIVAQRLGWDAATAAEAKAIELRHERDAIRPIADTIARSQAAREGGTKCLYVSDTYFPADFVHSQLVRCGVTMDSQDLFASSAFMATKESGKLYDVLLAKLAMKPSELAHLGDNIHADVRSARTRGIKAQHYLLQQPTRYERLYYDDRDGDRLLRSAVAGCARAVRLQRTFPDAHRQTIWNTSANVTGPLLVGYVLWILQEAKARGIERLYFLARDGQILVKVATILSRWLGLGIDCRYLCASRQALFLPALRDAAEAARACTAQEVSGLTLRQLMGRFDVDIDSNATIFDALGFAADAKERPLSAQERQTLADAMSAGAPLGELVLLRAAEQRTNLADYLRQEAVGSGQRFVLVDIGWKGGLQARFTRFMASAPELAARLPLLGFYFGLITPAPQNAGEFLTFVPDGRIVNGVVLEAFCAADHGSVRKFVRAPSGEVGPSLEVDRDEVAIDWGVPLQQEAVCAFAEQVTGALDPREIDLGRLCAFLRNRSVAAFQLLLAQPSPEEAAAFGSLPHAQDETHSLTQETAPAFRRREVLRFIFFRRRHAAVQSFWMQASLARAAGGDTSRRALWALWNARDAINKVVNRLRGHRD